MTKIAKTPPANRPLNAREPNILFWDIESTGLRATFATILCIGYKWYGKKKVYLPGIQDAAAEAAGNGSGVGHDMLDDRALVEKFCEAYRECDYHVTWYGKRFDKKMINAKLIRFGLPPLPPRPHLDLWEVARRYFNLHSNRMAVWQQYLGVEHEKTQIDFNIWRKAGLGHAPSIKEVKNHCKLDILVLEELFVKMRPWIDKEPNRQLFDQSQTAMSCTSCGSTNVTWQGYKRSKTRVYHQAQCQDCGKWMRQRISEKQPQLLIGDES